MEEMTDNQPKYNPAKHLEKHQWKKGQSGNPAGRPKGKTMKEYAKELLSCQTEEERQEFLHGLPKEVIWKMAEGNPANETEHKGELKVQILPSEVIDKNDIQISREPITDSEGQNEV